MLLQKSRLYGTTCSNKHGWINLGDKKNYDNQEA